MSPLKVLHVVSSLNLGDGITVVVKTLCQNLDRTRFSVSICCLAGRGYLADDFKQMGVNVYALNAKSSTSPLYILRNLYNTWKLVRWLRQEKFDIVHAHEFFSGTLGRLAGWLAGVPVIILALHNKDAWKRFPHVTIDRWLATVTDRIVTNSEATKQFAVEFEGLSEEKFVVIHNGIDLSRFNDVKDGGQLRTEWGIGLDELVVGTVGRLVEQKGFRYLIKAAAIVRSKRGDVKFVIVGPDGHPSESVKDELVRLVKDLRLERVVIFAGVRRDVPQIMSMFDLFVLPSLWEGFGLAVAEGMAMKKAVVISRVDALPEIVEDGVTGVLVPPGDENTLGVEILRLLEDRDLRLRMGAKGRERIEMRFTASVMTRKVEKLYESLTKSSDHGTSIT